MGFERERVAPPRAAGPHRAWRFHLRLRLTFTPEWTRGSTRPLFMQPAQTFLWRPMSSVAASLSCLLSVLAFLFRFPVDGNV